MNNKMRKNVHRSLKTKGNNKPRKDLFYLKANIRSVVEGIFIASMAWTLWQWAHHYDYAVLFLLGELIFLGLDIRRNSEYRMDTIDNISEDLRTMHVLLDDMDVTMNVLPIQMAEQLKEQLVQACKVVDCAEVAATHKTAEDKETTALYNERVFVEKVQTPMKDSGEKRIPVYDTYGVGEELLVIKADPGFVTEGEALEGKLAKVTHVGSYPISSFGTVYEVQFPDGDIREYNWASLAKLRRK